MASSLEVNKTLAAILTAGIIASGAGVVSRIIYSPHLPEENAYPIEVASVEGETAEDGGAAESINLAALLATGSPEAGATVAKKCAACHNFEEGGANKIGPGLWGVVGRGVSRPRRDTATKIGRPRPRTRARVDDAGEAPDHRMAATSLPNRATWR